MFVIGGVGAVPGGQRVGIGLTAGGVLSYFAERWGRRPTAALFFAAAFVITPVVFLWAHTVSLLLALLFVTGVFTMGQYGWMAVWLPELYPRA